MGSEMCIRDRGSAISNTMIWLENNALWAGLVVIAAAVGIMVIWKKHRED